jgi:hypothetical protein
MSKSLLISHLLLAETKVRAAAGDAPKEFEKSGQTAWAALCAAHASVGQKPLSSVLVRGRGLEPPRDCSHRPLKPARLPITSPALYLGKDAPITFKARSIFRLFLFKHITLLL